MLSKFNYYNRTISIDNILDKKIIYSVSNSLTTQNEKGKKKKYKDGNFQMTKYRISLSKKLKLIEMNNNITS